MKLTKKELEEKREYARLLFMNGESNRAIAERTSISENTIGKWANNGGWHEQRAASSISRPQLVNRLLKSIDDLLCEVNERKDPALVASLADKLAKFSAAIERLDKRTSVVDVIDVFMAFNRWMQFRAQSDPEITPELLKTFNKYHDLYINELLQKKMA
ncbi:MAG: terminase [Prevotellaceae bacterium]|nr:terminase [Prevotellaceae bacterium]